MKTWTQFYLLRLLSYTLFKDASKAIYYTSVKVIHWNLLKRQRTSSWPGLLRPDFLVSGQVEDPVQPPVEKQTADLQWMIIQGAIATDGHVAHLNPAVEGEMSILWGARRYRTFVFEV